MLGSRMLPSGCGARNAARSNARSERFHLASLAGIRRYQTKEGAGDLGPFGGSDRFDSSIARRRRFSRLFSMARIQR